MSQPTPWTPNIVPRLLTSPESLPQCLIKTPNHQTPSTVTLAINTSLDPPELLEPSPTIPNPIVHLQLTTLAHPTSSGAS
ncbi:hypothetical protein E4T56_gene13419 [Termitomyces sp. T112]|nr:hypothetical protein E4T56_gene13419 [Termitomyces sp. T112]